jgi:uncharacterized protein (TIGR01777 family)
MLGGALIAALAAEGWPVLQLVRRAPLAPDQVFWNPSSVPAIPELKPLEGLDAAIHLSGANLAAHRWTAGYKREIAASRVDSTRALATALARLEAPPRTLIVASATGIYGNRGDELLDESSAPGTGFLADLCQQWEAAALPAADAGIRVVHVRFSMVVAHDAGALARLVPLFRLGLGGPLGNGRQWMSWISLTDAVAAMLFALATETLAGPVNATAPRPVTNADFTRALAGQLHRPAFLPAPAFALRLALGQMADEALLASARAVPTRLLDAGFQFTHSMIDEALAAALQ